MTSTITPKDLSWWGSECVECGNTTPGSMVCDCCGSDASTVGLWRSGFDELEAAR